MNAFRALEDRAMAPLARDEAPLAVVIGSGFGGLAAAIRLSVRGWRVRVLEKLDAPGGRAYMHKQDGFRFDAGPTIITAPFLLEELWALCGRRMQDDIDLRTMSPFYRIRFDDGTHFDYSDDEATMLAQVAAISPGDVPGMRKLMIASERCKVLGFEGMGDKAFETIGDLMRALPSFARMQAWRSIYSLVAQHLKHPKLRLVMSFHPLLIGGNPFAVTCAYSLIHALERNWGVHSAIGGTGAIVDGLVGLLRERGVRIDCHAPVTRIHVEGGRARGVALASGEYIPADIVVSNGDSAWTYRHLIDPQYRLHWTDRRIEKGRYSMGLFVWYFGTRGKYPDVPHHMMVMGPRYRELLTDIFKRKKLAQDFSLYLHRPTATDPSVAPPGCDTFYALSPVPHLDSGTDWAEHAEIYRQAICERLEATVLPGLSQRIVTSRVTTPQEFQDRLWSYKGAGFGLEPLLTQSAWFRPHNRSEDIQGLYMVGASTHPGAGVPGVLMSAKALESVLPSVDAYAA
ncbi:MAG: hypothetical protein RL513_171 [Pseudomonadota bacterium]|jgi:phytoene desaturase